MKTDVYVVSGFLGAGKTTFIKRLLEHGFNGKKVALIENDFGEISVDASLLKGAGIEIKEMNAGCICCSLTGDFLASLKELLKDYEPEVLLIEPSGVGKLSDIIKVLEDESLEDALTIKSKITIVDVKRAPMYLDNFGEFFEDQVHHADVILLSRVEKHPESLTDAIDAINECKPTGVIKNHNWEELNLEEVLDPKSKTHHHHHEGCDCGCHDHHHHHADDVFTTFTFPLERVISEDALTGFLESLSGFSGELLRMKGVVQTESGPREIQYLPEEQRVTPIESDENILVFIGRDIQREEIKKALEEL